jgi:ATP-dependent RNA helicase RhlE
MTKFQEFGLAEPIVRAIAEEGYTTPTPIQVQAIPVVLNGRDLVGIAQTGTGKTASFALPILNHLANNKRRPEPKACRVLVLSPTRELSSQILDSFRTYGRHVGISADLVIGGVPQGRQVKALARGLDVLVATPGRLMDLNRCGALRLDRVEVFVLDEADRMLDMGFIRDIRTIITKLPVKRQTLLFSATMPADIAELADQMLRTPATVAVTPVATTVESVEQRVIYADRVAKPSLLSQVLKADAVERALVFTRTKHGADRVVRSLGQAGITAKAIHGNKSQNERERVLAAFRDGHVRTLVATDIAARGIDVTGITHVINYDLPNIPESYVHRIGRTARAGAGGVAVSFCDGEEAPFLRGIEKLIRMSIPVSDASLRAGSASAPASQQPVQADPGRKKRQPRRGRGAATGGAPFAGGHTGGGHASGGKPAGGKPAISKPVAAKAAGVRRDGTTGGGAGWPTWPSCAAAIRE